MARGRKVDRETKKRVQKGVSETKKAWDFARQVSSQPMGPGQSLAMAGNTGLAGFSENQAEQIKQAKQTTQDFFDQNKGQKSDPVSFKDIGQEIGEIGSKYRRPVDFLKTAQKAAMFNQGIAGGGKIVVGPDGIPRLQFGDQVVRDPITGAQMASMFLPRTFAEQPSNLGQFFGDVGRAFSGYDSIKYPDENFQGPFPSGQNADMPFMSRTPGMFEGINPLSLIPGVGTAMKIGEGIKGVYDFMFPKPPVVTYGGDSNITVTEEPIQTAPQFPYNFETLIKPKPDPLQPSEMSQEQFMESYPELYSGNPLFDIKSYDPIKVSSADPSTLTAESTGIDSILNRVKQLQNLGESYGLDSIQVDPFNLNEGIGYQNQFMFNDTPIDYSFSIAPGGNYGFNLSFDY